MLIHLKTECISVSQESKVHFHAPVRVDILRIWVIKLYIQHEFVDIGLEFLHCNDMEHVY